MCSIEGSENSWDSGPCFAQIGPTHVEVAQLLPNPGLEFGRKAAPTHSSMSAKLGLIVLTFAANLASLGYFVQLRLL